MKLEISHNKNWDHRSNKFHKGEYQYYQEKLKLHEPLSQSQPQSHLAGTQNILHGVAARHLQKHPASYFLNTKRSEP